LPAFADIFFGRNFLMSNLTPLDNHQPTLTLTQLLVEQGIFPARGTGDPVVDGNTDPLGIPIAAFRTFAGNFAIDGSEFANGQLKAISPNTALFSLLGTNFGGDGRTNFALPNAQGQVFVGTGQGTGLSNETLGQRTGLDSLLLNLGQMPASIGGNNTAFDNHQPSFGVTYMINTGGSNSGIDLVGVVVPTAANFAAAGYMLAQGQTLLIANYPALYAAIGVTYGGNGVTTFQLPDLRGRAIVGASAEHPRGNYFGQESVSVTTAELPASAGGHGDAIDNHQPSLAMTYLISTSGLFPSRGGGGSLDSSQAYLGEIIAYAGGTVPNGWVIAAGQTLAISTNTALFSLLGTQYGGNGMTTFKLPDLRGHAAGDAGTSIGLGTVSVGATFGSDTVTLLASNVIDALPHLTGVGASLSSVEHVFENIAAGATASDANLDLMNGGSGNYAGASLTLARHGGPSAEDTFGFDTVGANFTVSGGNLQSAGHTFATFTNAGGILTIVFDSSAATATTALVNNVIGHITYADQGNGPPASVVIDLALSDGNSGAQGAGAAPAIDTHSITINVLRPAAFDFGGDGHSDILWQNDNGTVSIWDSGQIAAAHIVAAAGVVPGGWHIAGASDFDGNGTADILWQNDNGAMSIWDNGQIGGAHVVVNPGVLPSGWHIAGTGDFDGNGHADILWQNDNGAVSIWDSGQIGGAHIVANAGLLPSGWHIAGTGDFDGNGHADILWQNDNGAVSIWDSGQIGGAHIVANAGLLPSSWHIAGIGDFNGGGAADILWRNDNGAISIWDSGQLVGAHIYVDPGVVSDNWHIARVGDFDGNGRADILWRSDNGAASIWDNGQIGSAHVIATIPNDWHIA